MCIAVHAVLRTCAWLHAASAPFPLTLPWTSPPPSLPQLVGQDPSRFEDAEGDESEQQPAAAAGSGERQPNGGC